MPLVDLTQHGAHVMTVCNACRYCEQYCPVFPAMEERRTFAKVDLAFLANLCHNCGECLYACQYAPSSRSVRTSSQSRGGLYKPPGVLRRHRS